jgi:hypothetical protein
MMPHRELCGVVRSGLCGSQFNGVRNTCEPLQGHCCWYVTTTKTIIWIRKARRNFDDHFSTALESRVSSRREKQVALGKGGSIRRERMHTPFQGGSDPGNIIASSQQHHLVVTVHT